MRIALRSKIHCAWVTGTSPDHTGSVIIDRALMDKVDMWEYEKVLICNITNGQRWETYALHGSRGFGTVSVQGVGARLCREGDCLIILSFEVTDVPIDPKMVLVDRDNRFVEYIQESRYEYRIF